MIVVLGALDDRPARRAARSPCRVERIPRRADDAIVRGTAEPEPRCVRLPDPVAPTSISRRTNGSDSPAARSSNSRTGGRPYASHVVEVLDRHGSPWSGPSGLPGHTAPLDLPRPLQRPSRATVTNPSVRSFPSSILSSRRSTILTGDRLHHDPWPRLYGPGPVRRQRDGPPRVRLDGVGRRPRRRR